MPTPGRFQTQKVKINIGNKIAMVLMFLTVVNMIIITIVFLFGVFDNQESKNQSGLSKEQLDKIQNQFLFLIMTYLFNALFDIVFVVYVYRAIHKTQIGYFFTITWFIIWCLFTGGLFFTNAHVAVKIVNLIVGVGSVLVLFSFFYQLQNRKRELDFKRLKEQRSL
ncbi:hypothetical protein [Williamsoniiplasma luminosum]|uniref:Uncharacterized protein n=1 Tax=Williamsoniiplasma luminosum TaxID=214888 RepID=A0A2S0NIZ2_9MOLU|nr:hypothetical protein [Williamsoniiplasma luminosum]AVP48987.1 MAG: hypothetical protein C5T88_00060 [Williamsoniiplasma luminosum]